MLQDHELFVTGAPLIHRGKTRNTYDTIDPNLLCVVASDRISTHNIVHASQIPNKGEVLTALSVFWFRMLAAQGCQHHLVASGPQIYDYLPGGYKMQAENLHHRAIIVRRLTMLPVEFIFRRYLVGSLYSKYYAQGLVNPYGVALEPGLPLMHRFLAPVFTPTDKSETDDPLDAQQVMTQYGPAYALALTVFLQVAEALRKVGIEYIDSKFEIGIDASGSLVLGDEVATPDSSRFTLHKDVREGCEPPWLDKELARQEAMRMWGKDVKIPLGFDPDVIARLSSTYREVFRMITGQTLEAFQETM